MKPRLSQGGLNLFLVLSFLLGTRAAQGYANFIGYGYTSCVVCHFNAFGGGPLTDYGRALGATAISAKPPWNPRASDERLGEESGFLGKPERLPEWFRPSINYRGLLYASQLGQNGQRQWINMVADTNLVVRGSDDRYLVVANLGYAPTPASLAKRSNVQVSHLISRGHYLSWQVQKGLRLMGGFMDQVYGIRTPDHIAYARQKTFMAQNDQSYGLAAHFGTSDFEGGLMVFAGNFAQESNLRLMGASGLFEFDALEKVRLGSSLYFGSNAYRSRQMGALHARVGAGEGSSFLAELGMIHERGANSSGPTLGTYIFLQSLLRMVRGVHLLVTGEYYTPNTFQPNARTFRVGPGLQYFPAQRLEFRLDLNSTRTLGGTTVTSDVFDFLAQVHLWF